MLRASRSSLRSGTDCVCKAIKFSACLLPTETILTTRDPFLGSSPQGVSSMGCVIALYVTVLYN